MVDSNWNVKKKMIKLCYKKPHLNWKQIFWNQTWNWHSNSNQYSIITPQHFSKRSKLNRVWLCWVKQVQQEIYLHLLTVWFPIKKIIHTYMVILYKLQEVNWNDWKERFNIQYSCTCNNNSHSWWMFFWEFKSTNNFEISIV